MTTHAPWTAPPELTTAQALAMTRGRALMRGIDGSDYERLSAAIDGWESWVDEWCALAAHYEQLADRYESAGWRQSAGEAAIRAALALHFAKLYAVCDEERYREITRRSVETCRRGHTLTREPFERIEVPFDGHYIVGNLRLPIGVERPPLALMIPGTESVKEEFPLWENVFLARGMATLSMDGPGQGEVGFERHIRADYEVPVTAMLDAIADRRDIDLDRVAAVGMSLGGYYAMRAAAFEPRIKAVMNNGGPRNLGTGWDERIIPLYRAKFVWNLGAQSDAEGRERAFALDLSPILDRISVPALVMYGTSDPLIDQDFDARELVNCLADGELWVFEGGNHGVTNYSPEHLGPAADWLISKLV